MCVAALHQTECLTPKPPEKHSLLLQLLLHKPEAQLPSSWACLPSVIFTFTCTQRAGPVNNAAAVTFSSRLESRGVKLDLLRYHVFRLLRRRPENIRRDVPDPDLKNELTELTLTSFIRQHTFLSQNQIQRLRSGTQAMKSRRKLMYATHSKTEAV